MFLTGMAPNLLAVELVRKTVGVDITWMRWFLAFAPVGVVLLLTLPLLVYLFYPPTIKEGTAVAAWAADELERMGPPTFRELTLAILVLLALALWIVGGSDMNPTTTALVIVGLMLLTKVVTWEDIATNRQAWGTLVWFATLIALADGLNRTGFVIWFATSVAGQVAMLSATTAMIVLVSAYFVSHYLFASITAHTTALLPVMLSVGAAIPGMSVPRLSLLLVLSGGLMSILTPYAGGPNPVYYGSGYLSGKDFWRLGAIFGFMFFAAWLSYGLWLMPIR